MEGQITFTVSSIIRAIIYGGYALVTGLMFAAVLAAAVLVYAPVPEYPVFPTNLTQEACEQTGGVWLSEGNICDQDALIQAQQEGQKNNSYWMNMALVAGAAAALIIAAFGEKLGSILRLSFAFGGLAALRFLVILNPLAGAVIDKRGLAALSIALLVMWYGAYYLGRVKRVWEK